MRAKRVALEQVSGLSLIQPGPGEGGTSPLAKVPKSFCRWPWPKSSPPASKSA